MGLYAHRLKNMGSFNFTGRAGRARAYGDAIQIESDKRHLGAKPWNRKACSIRKARRILTEDRGICCDPANTGFERLTKTKQTFGQAIAAGNRRLERGGETRDPGYVFGAGTLSSLLAAAT